MSELDGLPSIIHLPDQSEPEPAPPPPRQGPRRSGNMKGRHFGPRPVADPRTARLQIRCTPRTQQKALEAALADGLSISGYVCALIDGSPGPRAHRRPSVDAAQNARIVAALGRSGNNLNQLLQEVRRYDFNIAELIEMHPAIIAAATAHKTLCEAIMARMGF